MKRIAALALLLVATPCFATFERGVTPGAAGPNRLDVDVTLLSQATSDLRDLRLVDASGREVGYLLVEPKSRESRWIDGRVLPIAATKKTSGFELDLGQSETVDRLRLAGIAAPFLKRVRVEGSGDRNHWTLLADATVFDLPDDRLRLLDVPFEAGAYRYLRATWDDASSARITSVGGASARVHNSASAPEPLRAPLAFRKRASEPGKSRYRIDLPGPHLPIDAIELRVANGNVFRTATITEPRLGNGEVLPTTLGSATVRRAERWGAIAADMTVPIESPTGRQLDLVVDDANNPPLALTEIVARFQPQPWIYFEAADTAPLVAHYGDPRLTAPRYDLEASRRYLDTAKPAIATWEKNVAMSMTARKQESDPGASLRGAAVDRNAFHIVRAVPNAPAGLSVLLLDADVLARSRELADVRLVTADNLQVPYVVEKRDEPLVIPLTLARTEGERGTSKYRITLPYPTLPAETKLVLRTNARVFERNVELRGAAEESRGRGPVSLDAETWRATDPELLPPALTFFVPAGYNSPFDIVLYEGDNAPLPITSAELLLPSIALRFHHPGAPLFLLYGNKELAPPLYDLALLAPRLFAQPAHELTLASSAAPKPEEPADAGARKFFWIAIAIAAIVLLLMLGRLLKRPLVSASD